MSSSGSAKCGEQRARASPVRDAVGVEQRDEVVASRRSRPSLRAAPAPPRSAADVPRARALAPRGRRRCSEASSTTITSCDVERGEQPSSVAAGITALTGAQRRRERLRQVRHHQRAGERAPSPTGSPASHARIRAADVGASAQLERLAAEQQVAFQTGGEPQAEAAGRGVLRSGTESIIAKGENHAGSGHRARGRRGPEVEEDLVEEDLLVEDVSIDGMCGVY